jgi:hypothetical protein
LSNARASRQSKIWKPERSSSCLKLIVKWEGERPREPSYKTTNFIQPEHSPQKGNCVPQSAICNLHFAIRNKKALRVHSRKSLVRNDSNATAIKFVLSAAA